MMGSACSMQCQTAGNPCIRRAAGSRHEQNGLSRAESGGLGLRSSLRHSVITAIPDGSISALYPVEDNYVNVGDGQRSPKSLAELATDALCRSLPRLSGELPPGLPQDVVTDIVQSLIQHSALNATTLRALRFCELGSLSLAGCRGVTDEWLEALSCSGASSPHLRTAGSSPRFPPSPDHEDFVDSMDLDYVDDGRSGEVFYGTFDDSRQMRGSDESSSCSTSSFLSTTSGVDEHPQPAASSHYGYHFDPSGNNAAAAAAAAAATAAKTRPTLDDDDAVLMSDHSYGSNSKRSRSHSASYSYVTSNMTLLDLRGSQRLTDRGLLKLVDLGRLEVVKLDNCHALTGRGLLALSHSHRLHTLSLANCRRLTDEALINISHLMSLQAISVDGCRCLTDRSLAAISDLYSLKKLDLSQCDLITNDGLEHLESLEALEEFSLGWCRQVGDAGVEIITGHPGRAMHLRVLRLARCSITDVGVAHLARLTRLEELDLNGCSNVRSSALGTVLEQLPSLTTLDVSYVPGVLKSGWQGKIKCLKTLEVCYSSVKDSHIMKLSSLPALEELNLDSCPVGDFALGHLADNNVTPNLTSLDMADTNLTDAGMAHIAKFGKLAHLSLFYCNITNSGLRYLAQLSELESLNLDSRDISDEGLRHLSGLSKLKHLDIFSGRVTDSGCVHISQIKSLESLELCGGGIGDHACSLLAKLENLTSLNLSQNERITNRGAAALAALVNLKTLNLSNTRVSSAALRFLGGLVQLQSLALYGCRGIEVGAGLDRLQNGLPKLKCLRLNKVSDDDEGMMVFDNTSDESSVERWEPLHNNPSNDDEDFYSDHD